MTQVMNSRHKYIHRQRQSIDRSRRALLASDSCAGACASNLRGNYAVTSVAGAAAAWPGMVAGLAVEALGCAELRSSSGRASDITAYVRELRLPSPVLHNNFRQWDGQSHSRWVMSHLCCWQLLSSAEP